MRNGFLSREAIFALRLAVPAPLAFKCRGRIIPGVAVAKEHA